MLHCTQAIKCWEQKFNDPAELSGFMRQNQNRMAKFLRDCQCMSQDSGLWWKDLLGAIILQPGSRLMVGCVPPNNVAVPFFHSFKPILTP